MSETQTKTDLSREPKADAKSDFVRLRVLGGRRPLDSAVSFGSTARPLTELGGVRFS